MANEWEYKVYFRQLPSTEFFASLLPQILGNETRFRLGPLGRVQAWDSEGEEVELLPSEIPASLAASCCLRLYELALNEDVTLSSGSDDSGMGRISLTLDGNPVRDVDRARDLEARKRFMLICSQRQSLFGYCETAYGVENLWSNMFGVEGWRGLLNVGRIEADDIAHGQIPRVIPWLTYVSEPNFPHARKILSSLPDHVFSRSGDTGLLVQLADGPWANVFAARRDPDGPYEIVDQFGEPYIDEDVEE